MIGPRYLPEPTRENPLCGPSVRGVRQDAAHDHLIALPLPGQVRAVATSDPSGPLTVIGYGANPLVTVITRVDLSGKVAWQRTYPGTGRPQSRLSTEGTL